MTRERTTDTSDDAVVLDRIEDWRRRLIDLTYRNRLIKYRRTKASTLELQAPSVEVLLADPGRAAPWKFYFPPEPENQETIDFGGDAAAYVDEVVVRAAQHSGRAPRQDEIVVKDIDARQLNRILENLARKSNAEFQDKALRILYIAAGFLDWLDPAREEAISSPLILVPVELRRETASQAYSLYFVDDEEIVVNPSLTEKLRRDVGRRLADEWLWEDKPIADELEEIEHEVSDSGWTVRRDTAIGLFSFQKYVMFRDLLDNEGSVADHAAVRSLATGRLADELASIEADVPPLDELDDVQPPAHDLSILDADSTQRRCIEAAKRGQSFVMQGPPGTGKSQTIANVISGAIGQGRRVLFVSEKAAALDVVHRRLAAQGLDEFCLMLHGEHAARREVVESLNHSLTTQLVPRAGMSSHELERLAQLREILNSTAQLVHLPMSQLGDRSMHDVLGELAELHEAPSVPASPEPSQILSGEVREEFRVVEEVFQRLAERWRVSPREFPWRDFAASRFSTDDHGRVLTKLRKAVESTQLLEALAGDAARLLGWPVPANLRAVTQFLELGEHLETAPELEAHWLEAGFETKLAAEAEEAHSTFALDGRTTATLAAWYRARTIDDFAPSLEPELESSLEELTRVAGRTDTWEGSLIPALEPTRRFLQEAPRILSRLSSSVEEAARLLGQPADELTYARAGQIAELAALAFREDDRPEAEWLVGAGLERVRKALQDFGPKLDRYENERATLFARFEDGALDIDAAGLQRRFETEHTSFVSRVRPAYRRDAKLVKSVRRDGKLPDDLVSELASLAALQGLGLEIDSAEKRLARSFGSFHRGRSTLVSDIVQAAEVAERVIELSAPGADLTALSERVSAGSRPDTRAAQLADQIRAASGELERGLNELSSIGSRTGSLCRHLDRESIGSIRERLSELTRAFDKFESVVRRLAEGSKQEINTLSMAAERAAVIRDGHLARHAIAERGQEWSRTLGRLYRGAGTDWEGVAAVARWLARFGELLGESLPSALQAQLLQQPRRWPDFAGARAARDTYLETTTVVADLFERDRAAEVAALSRETALEEARRFLGHLSATIDDLYDWAEFRSWRDRAREENWGEFLATLIDHEVPEDQVVPAFRRAYWSRRLEALFEDDPSLADRGAAYDRWIRDFQDLDRRLVKTATDRVIAARNRLRTTHVAVEGSEVSLIRREAAKRRRHMPVRKLLAAIPSMLSELKPCLMMSPLTVSHFLSPDHTFDLVIFDEASQVPPQDAINCIYRGKQLIVAGDTRQLPPTPFFQVAEADEAWDEDSDPTEDMESILDSCEALLPQHPLQWHYRSRHEDLIAFSNTHIYNDSLWTFPSADHDSPSKGVRLTYVANGVYDRGRSKTNRREARAVAERVIEHLQNSPRSVGVIAFSRPQADAISEELDRLRIENPDVEGRFSGDRLDSVFVKHLESVQGDERDVILFSVGYGRDEDGKFLMNFGPLNKEGGYRRLNVAVTRAREVVEVFSSVRAADFALSDQASRGARLLQEYLRYAETSAESTREGSVSSVEEFASSLEAAIGEAVVELGYEAVPQVGAGSFRVDIAVRDPSAPETFALGITTDGRTYSSTPTARDRDRLREAHLRELHWKVHRIWSLDWVRNRDSEVGRLRETLESGGRIAETSEEEDQDDFFPHERTEREVAELKDAYDSEHLAWVVEYERVELPTQDTGYDFAVSINRDRQRDLLVDLLEVEAPVHIDYAIGRLAEAWGRRRVTKPIDRAGRQAISMAMRNGSLEKRGEFLWRPGQALSTVRSPCFADDRTWRSIEKIPPEEIDFAIRKLADASGGEVGEHLIADVGKVLGYFRVGGQIRQVVARRIAAVKRESNRTPA